MSSPETPPDDPHDNVIRLPTGRERREMQQDREKAPSEPFIKAAPLINLPPVTKVMILAFLAIHILTDVILSAPHQYWVFMHFGFVPGYYTGEIPFGWAALAGPFTFTFLHGNWTHIILNGLMMMAFGTGAERWMGSKRMFAFFMLCNIFAALAQFVFSPFSTGPVIGASGGLSGLFAAILLMMQQQGLLGHGRRSSIVPFILLWVIISVLFGVIGGPGDGSIAWAAHIGGFLAGFALYKPIMKARIFN